MTNLAPTDHPTHPAPPNRDPKPQPPTTLSTCPSREPLGLLAPARVPNPPGRPLAFAGYIGRGLGRVGAAVLRRAAGYIGAEASTWPA